MQSPNCPRSLRALLAALGPAAPAHSILVFTRGDELEADDTPLYEFLRDSPPYLKARVVMSTPCHTRLPIKMPMATCTSAYGQSCAPIKCTMWALQ